jgi:hypothetical protein
MSVEGFNWLKTGISDGEKNTMHEISWQGEELFGNVIHVKSLDAILWHCANDKFLVFSLGIVRRRY